MNTGKQALTSYMPHEPEMYVNISLLHVAVVNNDLETMYTRMFDGCDPTYSGTAIKYYFDDGWYFVAGQTSLHIASIEGSYGESWPLVLAR